MGTTYTTINGRNRNASPGWYTWTSTYYMQHVKHLRATDTLGKFIKCTSFYANSTSRRVLFDFENVPTYSRARTHTLTHISSSLCAMLALPSTGVPPAWPPGVRPAPHSTLSLHRCFRDFPMSEPCSLSIRCALLTALKEHTPQRGGGSVWFIFKPLAPRMLPGT